MKGIDKAIYLCIAMTGLMWLVTGIWANNANTGVKQAEQQLYLKMVEKEQSEIDKNKWTLSKWKKDK